MKGLEMGASLVEHWVWELTLAPYASTQGKTRNVGCWFVGAVWPPPLPPPPHIGGGGGGAKAVSCSFDPTLDYLDGNGGPDSLSQES